MIIITHYSLSGLSFPMLLYPRPVLVMPVVGGAWLYVVRLVMFVCSAIFLVFTVDK